MAVASELTLFLESRLQRAENDLERFFDLSLDLFCIAGMDGFFRRVNSNFPRVLGFSEKHLLTRPFLEFVHPDDRDPTISVMSQLKIGQPVVQFRNRYMAVDGSYRCFEWTAKSIPEEGTIFAVARDVTDSRQIGR
jgi:serine/threonine-protein kinase